MDNCDHPPKLQRATRMYFDPLDGDEFLTIAVRCGSCEQYGRVVVSHDNLECIVAEGIWGAAEDMNGESRTAEEPEPTNQDTYECTDCGERISGDWEEHQPECSNAISLR